MIEHIWNGEGHRCIAFINQHGTLSHKWFDTTEKAMGFAQWLTARQVDLWYAVALYKEQTKRRQDNVASMGALFLDLDCGEGKDYADQAEAVTALRGFCQAAGLPRPTVVNSGRGIHAYWLTPRMSKTEWQRKALGLKQLCVTHGLKADPARTSDAASLMRLPGTYNCKVPTDPRPIQVLMPSEVVSDLPIPDVEPPSRKERGPASAFDIIEPSNNPTSDDVAMLCAQARNLRDTQGNVEEPLWYAGLGLVRHCSDGAEAAHLWSNGHPDYDPDEVELRLSRLEDGDIGPTTCDRFRSLNPEGCAGCPLAGGITSPIQVRAPKEAPAAVEVAEQVTAHCADAPWRTDREGVWYDPSDEPPVKILDVPLYISRLGRVGGEVVAVMTWLTRAGNWMTADMPLKTLGEPRSIKGWLLSNSIVGSWAGKEGHVVMYISDIVRKVQENDDPTIIAEQFGWQSSTRFLIGRRELSPEGTRPARPAESITRKIVDGLVPEGTLSDWRQGIAVLNKPGYEYHAFTVLAAMAAPILNIMDVSGAVLSLAGPSGTGKSTAQKFALSIFGKPDALLLSPDSTYVAKNSMMKSANNLPVAVDDISGKHTHEIGGLMYMAANGRAKERGNQLGDMRDTATWQTVLIISTNNPVMDLPEKYLVEAERRRVLELPVVKPLDREDAILLNEIMKSSYGVMCDDYIRVLIDRREEISQRANDLWREWLRSDEIPDQNRFGVWLCAAARIAGEVAVEAGLISMDVPRVVGVALDSLREATEKMVDPVAQIEELVAEYVNKNAGRFSQKTRNPNKFLPTYHEIRGVVAGCFITNQNEMIIPVADLRNFMHAEGIPGTAMSSWIAAKGIEIGLDRLLPADRGGKQVRCYKIPYEQEDENVSN